MHQKICSEDLGTTLSFADAIFCYLMVWLQIELVVSKKALESYLCNFLGHFLFT
jgi:hypothetical protein